MRDTDRDRVSHFVARARRCRCERSPICEAGRSPTGATDSPQATLIPLGRLRREGLDPGARPHGPPLRRARRQARRSRRRRARRLRVRCASGEAAACAMLDLNWDGWTQDGTIDPEPFRDRRRDRPLRPLRLHRPRGSRRRVGAALARRAVRDALRQSRPPRNDGSRRAEGVAARAAPAASAPLTDGRQRRTVLRDGARSRECRCRSFR